MKVKLTPDNLVLASKYVYLKQHANSLRNYDPEFAGFKFDSERVESLMHNFGRVLLYNYNPKEISLILASILDQLAKEVETKLGQLDIEVETE